MSDDSTASPVVTPDGHILYAAGTRYNYGQGHLMMFTASGQFAASYPAGWDCTPAVVSRGSSYAIVVKENRYNVGSYCNDRVHCPLRNHSVPDNPEQYFITQLDEALSVEWRFRSNNTTSCSRDAAGLLRCVDDHPYGFEWCVSAVAVDRDGTIYANSEDGYIYATDRNGKVRERLFLQLALRAAYSPVSIGSDGTIYTLNDGVLFVVTENARRRAVRN